MDLTSAVALFPLSEPLTASVWAHRAHSDRLCLHRSRWRVTEAAPSDQTLRRTGADPGKRGGARNVNPVVMVLLQPTIKQLKCKKNPSMM